MSRFNQKSEEKTRKFQDFNGNSEFSSASSELETLNNEESAQAESSTVNKENSVAGFEEKEKVNETPDTVKVIKTDDKKILVDEKKKAEE